MGCRDNRVRNVLAPGPDSTASGRPVLIGGLLDDRQSSAGICVASACRLATRNLSDF